MIIEERGRARLRRIRTALAVVVATAILAVGAVVWAYGRLLGEDVDAGWLMPVAGIVHAAGGRWRGRRDRRADLRWRPALVLSAGVRPGLQARWSRSAVATDALAAAALAGSGLLHSGGEVGTGSVWFGPTISVAAGAMTFVFAALAFRRVRRSGYVTITAHGVAHRGNVVRWERIKSVFRDKDGVHLRLNAETPQYVDFGSTDCAVSDERLTEVIKFYLAEPRRRSALDTGPDQLALPARPGPA